MACTCMCALSVAGATKHGKVSKTESTVRSEDMSFSTIDIMASYEAVAYDVANTSMSVNTKSIAFPTKVENSNLIMYGHKRWQSTGYSSINKFKILKYPLIDYPLKQCLYRADGIARK